MAILRTKAASDNIVLPTEVITLLATNIATNIREIEGAYNKIVAYTSLMHMPITVETAQKVLSDMGNDIKTRTITYEGIIKLSPITTMLSRTSCSTKSVPRTLPSRVR